mgnify:CR=1 FL=1
MNTSLFSSSMGCEDSMFVLLLGLKTVASSIVLIENGQGHSSFLHMMMRLFLSTFIFLTLDLIPFHSQSGQYFGGFAGSKLMFGFIFILSSLSVLV